jgi:hypothetical protein
MLVIADVCGKGMAAALCMTIIVSATTFITIVCLVVEDDGRRPTINDDLTLLALEALP